MPSATWPAGPPAGPGPAAALTAVCLPPAPLWPQRGQRGQEGTQPTPRAGCSGATTGAETCLPRSCCEAQPRRSFGKEDRGTTDTPPQLPSFLSPGRPLLARGSSTTSLLPQGSFPPPPPLAFLQAVTGQGTCLFILQPSPWQQPWESCPLPGRELPRATPGLSQPWLGAPHGGRQAEGRRGGDTGSPRGPGLLAGSAPARHRGPAGGPEAAPGLQLSPTQRLGSSRPGLEPCLGPAGPALLRGLPKTTLWSLPGPGAPCQHHGGPAPTALGPVPLPSPNCHSSCHRQLSPISIPSARPNRPSKTPLPTASPFLPEPGSHHHPRAWHWVCIPGLPSRTAAGPHLPCAQGAAGGRGPGQKAGDGAGGRGLARSRGRGRGQSHRGGDCGQAPARAASGGCGRSWGLSSGGP